MPTERLVRPSIDLQLLAALAFDLRPFALSLHQTQLVMLTNVVAVSKHQTLQAFNSKKPQLGEDIFVAPNSSMIGDVTLGRSSSVWYGAVLRGGHA